MSYGLLRRALGAFAGLSMSVAFGGVVAAEWDLRISDVVRVEDLTEAKVGLPDHVEINLLRHVADGSDEHYYFTSLARAPLTPGQTCETVTFISVDSFDRRLLDRETKQHCRGLVQKNDVNFSVASQLPRDVRAFVSQELRDRCSFPALRAIRQLYEQTRVDNSTGEVIGYDVRFQVFSDDASAPMVAVRITKDVLGHLIVDGFDAPRNCR